MGEHGCDTKASKTVFHFFQIKCTRYTNALFIIRTFKRHRIWVNSRLFCITDPRDQRLFIELNKGLNTIIIETPWAKTYDKFSVRISAYEAEIKKDRLDRVLSDTLIPIGYEKFVYPKSIFLYNKEPFIFNFFANDQINFDKNQVVALDFFYAKKTYEKNLLVKKTLKLGEKCVIDVSDYHYPNPEELNALRLKIAFLDKSGNEHIIRRDIYLYDLKIVLNSLIEKAQTLLRDNFLNDYDIVVLKYRLKYFLTFNGDLLINQPKITSFYDELEKLHKKIHLEYTSKREGCRSVYFHSNIDNSENYYDIYLPKDYNSENKYPIVFIISTEEHSEYSKFFENYQNEAVIAVDISQRGFTMGSYIGEAAILEQINLISDSYSIDENRIYLMGHSNGAYAVWALSTAYPHIFAGALIVSGQPDYNCIRNLYNLKVINISSETEYGYNANFEKISEYTKNMKSFKSICAENHTHNSLLYIMLNGKIIKELLLGTREIYPNHIEYSTRHTRHRQAYWIKLHGITQSYEYGKISVDIIKNTINISAENITGITIQIPPQINKEKFAVIINKQFRFSYTSFDKEKIFYTYANEHWREYDNEIAPIHQRKGNGILDVYLNKMLIVICSEDNMVLNCARAFSQPISNGVNPQIAVKYPIIKIEDENVLRSECNLIIINNNKTNPLTEQLNKLCKISMDDNGYLYKDKYVDGEYCILQTLTHPLNNKYSILYVNTNNSELLMNNLVTRKIILPSYANGYHVFFNNDALIYTGRYYKIFEYDMDIEIIN